MRGLFNTGIAAVMSLALITVPASSVKAETANEWIPQLSNVLDLVYCIVGTGSCVGLEPGADLVTPDDGLTQDDVEAAVAAAMPDCDFDGGQVWDGQTCADPEPNCFLMGLCGQDGAGSYDVTGPYSQMTQSDAVALGPACVSAFYDGVSFTTYILYTGPMPFEYACD